MNNNLVLVQQEVNQHLQNKETVKMLVATTFKGLNEAIIPQAITEGILRGFTFKDFLEKNVYAIPYGQGYSLVTSIDYARKIGGRSGVVGKSEPTYREEGDLGLTCSITVKKKFQDGYIGDFSANVYFKEFTTGKNLWATKPRMMIAKVAEMHALRMACPEELSQSYVEEELQAPIKVKPVEDMAAHRAKLESTTSLEDLKTVWAAMPAVAKSELNEVKETLKAKYESAQV